MKETTERTFQDKETTTERRFRTKEMTTETWEFRDNIDDTTERKFLGEDEGERDLGNKISLANIQEYAGTYPASAPAPAPPLPRSKPQPPRHNKMPNGWRL